MSNCSSSNNSSFNFNKEAIQKKDERHPNSNPHTVVQSSNNNTNQNANNANNNSNSNISNLNLNLNPLKTPKLNPNAAAFSPHFSMNTPGSINNPSQQILNNDFSSQLMDIEKMLAQSVMKLQEFSLKLNELHLINQQQGTTQTLQEYQNVYAQYQLEFTNCFLLNQSLQTLNNIVFARNKQQQSVNNANNQLNDPNNDSIDNTPIGPSSVPPLSDSNTCKGNRSSPLETIQEEGEEVSDIDDDDSDLIADQAVYDEEYNDDYLDDSKSEEGLDNEERPLGDTRNIDINEDNSDNDDDQDDSARITDTFGGEHIRDALTGEQLSQTDYPFQYSPKELWTVQEQYKAEGLIDSGLTEGLDKKKLAEILKEMQYGREYILKKKIRGVLNKITPENFDKLSQEIVAIINSINDECQQTTKCTPYKENDGNGNGNGNGNDDEDSKMSEFEEFQKAQFQGIINLILGCILEKSVNEPLFSNQYARLCNSLFLYLFNDVSKKQAFRKELLCLCHGLFVKYRNDGSNYKFIGIITMIGDLFTYGLISWNVIISGIFESLLPPKSAVDIFALCELLKTAGNELDKYDKSNNNQTINGYIAKMRRFSEKFDKRIQFKVDEICEMRQNQWKRRKDLKPDSPKTLKQIHRDFHDSKNRKKAVESSRSVGPSHSTNSGYVSSQQHQPTRYNNNRNDRNSYNNNNGRYRRRHARHHPQYQYNDYNNNNNKPRYHSKYHNNNNNSHHGNGRYNNNNNNNRRRNGKYQSRPTAEFVKDVTLPDRTPYPGNKILTKTWKMRNAGDMQWGDDVELVYFKGHETLSLQKRYPVMNVDGGEEVEISATIKTPNTPGRYCTYFRLQQYGKFFGPRVWVDIIVADVSSNNGNNNIQCSRGEQRNGKRMFGKEQQKLGNLVRCSS